VAETGPDSRLTGDDPCLDNIPDQTPIEDLGLDPVLDGLGGTLPSVLDPEQAAGILAEVYARLPDTTGPDGVSDGFPDLPLDANGNPLDQSADWSFVSAPVDLFGDGVGDAACTSDNPFPVDANGFVIYTGVAGGIEPGSGPLEHDWFLQIKLFGTGTNLDAGGDPNSSGENRNAGAVNLRDDLPGAAKIRAVLGANGRMETEAGDFRCVGSGFVDLQGGLDPTLPRVALAALAASGLLLNARPALTWGGRP
jgi:hypothetical protein